MEHLAPLHSYEFVANGDQRRQLQTMTDNLLAGIKTVTKKKEVKATKKKGKKKKESSSESECDMDIDALFG